MATKTKDRPRISGKQVATAAAVVGGVAAVGAALFFAKDKSSERPDYETLEQDGDFEIREYPELLVAETVVGEIADRKEASNEGFRTLADYIFAKSRDGEKIAMTAPVLVDRPPADEDDDGLQGWRTRFVMPSSYASPEALPPAPREIEIVELPARRVAALTFSGLNTEERLQEKEAELRAWIEGRPHEGEAGTVEYAFYDAPIIPGPLRRNEILIPLG